MNIRNLLIRIKTLSTSFVTYAIAVTTFLTLGLSYLPSNAPDNIAKIVAAIVSFLTASVAIVRKVTPVITKDIGLLPVVNPTPAPKAVPPVPPAA